MKSMNTGEADEPANAKCGENSPYAWERVLPGNLSRGVIKRIAEDLKGAAHLCSALSQPSDHSVRDPKDVKAVGNLVRRVADRLRDELAAAEASSHAPLHLEVAEADAQTPRLADIGLMDMPEPSTPP
jgi:hypothetical protein